MALSATIFKVNLQVADMNRHYYAEHALTLSRHPSENDERMMVRLLAFALNAHPHLDFGQGMIDDESADLWQKDMTGAIELWIDVGLPDERLVRKACGRAKQVIIYCYGGRATQMWFDQNASLFARQKNLNIISFSQESTKAMTALVQRKMELQCNIQEDQIWLMDAKENVTVTYNVLMSTNEA